MRDLENIGRLPRENTVDVRAIQSEQGDVQVSWSLGGEKTSYLNDGGYPGVVCCGGGVGGVGFFCWCGCWVGGGGLGGGGGFGVVVGGVVCGWDFVDWVGKIGEPREKTF